MAGWGSRSTGAGSRRFAAVLVVAAFTVLAVAFFGRGASAAPASPLSVVKSASVSSVASGGQLTYTIVITNTGGSSVGNAVLTDQVNGIGVIQSPPALPQLQITSTKGSCTQGGPNGNLVTCNGGTLAGGASWTVTIGGQVTAGASTTLNNTASVSATKTSQSFTTLSNPVSVQVTGSGGNLPDLTINKTGPTTVAPNSPITYTLTVNNIGSGNATGVKVVDTVPSGIGSITASGTSLFNCGVSSQTVTCTGGAVNQGQNATITINGTVTLSGGTLTNTAVVDPDNTIPESNELNNTSATVNTTVSGPPPPALLEIKKTDGNPVPNDPSDPPMWWTGAGPDPVNPGQPLTYKILVVNRATGMNPTAGSLVVTDGTQGLDASSIVASETVVNGAVAKTDGCTVIAPQVRCTVKTLNSLGTIAITITGTVLQSAGSSIFNSATVTGNIRNQGVTNTATETTTVRPKVDLTVTDDDSPDPVCAHSWPVDSPTTQHLPSAPANPLSAASGHPAPLLQAPDCLGGLTYSLVVGNSGNGPASGVEVRDPLPAGAIFDSYQDVDSAGFKCSLLPGNVVDCTGGSIGAASIVHLNLLVVAPPNTGSITNVVTVDPNNTIFESDETNNTVSQTTAVSTGVDLVVWKGHKKGVVPPGSPTYATLSEGFDPVATNGTETYTIYVDNVGTQDTTNVKVVDTLPAGTKFLSAKADPNQGFSCSHDGSATGGNVTCIGGHLRGTESEFYTAPGGVAPAGEDHATITIKVFATPNVQPAMHNEVRVDPDNTIPEANELNNLYTDDTKVATGNADSGAFNQLTITKTQVSPGGSPPPDVATNGTLVYNLHVANLGTDPVSNVVVKDFLPTGSRFISATDTDTTHAARFFCTHDGSPTGGVVTCTGGDFSGSFNTIPDTPGPGDVPTARDIKITIFAPNVPGTYTNHATVDPDNVVPEGNEFDNDSSVDTKVAVGGANAFNELTITKKQIDPDPLTHTVATSSPVTYQIDVANTGTDPAFNVKVTDTLPAGFTFISAIDTAGPSDPYKFVCVPGSGNTIDCTGATLSGTVNVAPGEPTSRTIIVKAFSSSVPGDYTNTAIVDPQNAIPEGDETNNTAKAETTVKNGGPGKYIDLQIKKTQESPTTATVAPGGQITYNLRVSNSGSQDAFNVTARDVLPQHVTLQNATDLVPNTNGAFTCAASNGVVNCTGGTIPAGGFRDITVQVVVDTNIEPFSQSLSDVHISITNQAFVDPDNTIPEGDETNNSSSVDTTIAPRINLTVTKDGPKTASQNDTADYTITVTNNTVNGGATANGVVVVDNLPIGLIPLSWTADGNFQCQIFENPVNQVSCVGDIETGKTATITVHTFVTQDGGTLDNQACVDPNNTITETNETDNCVDTTTTVLKPAPDLSVQKTADVSTASPGQTITYGIHVINVGDATAQGPITLTDALDTTNLDFVSVSSSDGSWTCSFSSPNVTCTSSGSLAPSDGTDITLKARIKAGATGSISNTASVPDSTAFDPSAPECSGGATCVNEGDSSSASTNTNNKSTATVTVGGTGADLALLTFTDNPEPSAPGGLVTYTGVVKNLGTLDETGVVVRTVIPTSDADYVVASGTNGFTCVFATPNVDCTGDLPAGGSATFTTVLKVTKTPVAPAVDTSISVEMSVDPSNAIAEDNESNNDLTQVTTVHQSCSSCVDLVMSPIVVSPTTVAKDGIANFTIGVSNAGDTATSSFDIALKLSNASDFDFEPGGFDASQPSDDYSATAGATTGFDCSLPLLSDTVTCTGDLNPGQGVVINLHVHVKASATHPFLSLEATADPSNAITEFSEINNTANGSIGIGP